MLKITRNLLKAAAVILGLVIGAASAAEPRNPLQREDLALIEKQLSRIEPVIDRIEARQRHTPQRRVIFDTQQLRTDIRTIRAGIRTYLAPPRRLPHQPPPLSGQYLEQERKQ